MLVNSLVATAIAFLLSIGTKAGVIDFEFTVYYFLLLSVIILLRSGSAELIKTLREVVSKE